MRRWSCSTRRLIIRQQFWDETNVMLKILTVQRSYRPGVTIKQWSKDAIKLHIQNTWWYFHSKWIFQHSQGHWSFHLWFLCCGLKPQYCNFSRFKSCFCETIKVKTPPNLSDGSEQSRFFSNTPTMPRCSAVSCCFQIFFHIIPHKKQSHISSTTNDIRIHGDVEL